jgi:hypothetical protein
LTETQCKDRANLPLDAIRRPGDTPIWKLEESFRCWSCGKRSYRPPVHMIRLTQEQEIAPTCGPIPTMMIGVSLSRLAAAIDR